MVFLGGPSGLGAAATNVLTQGNAPGEGPEAEDYFGMSMY